MSITTTTAVPIAATIASAVATACLLAFALSSPAGATVQFAKETGLSCGACHTNPHGAGPLTSLGEKFKANGNKMP